MKNASITSKRLKEVLEYDRETGVFTWISRRRGVRTGSRAGSLDRKTGYRSIRVDGVTYYAQRLAWLWEHGAWPRLIRFQDGNADNCAIGNLCEGFYLATTHDHRTREGRAAYQMAYRAENRGRFNHAERERKFGLSLAAYSALVAEQDNKCAICRQAETATRNGKVKALAVDHCHETGAVRGLLCSDCNTGIGKLKEDRAVLLAAVRYIDKHTDAQNVVSLGLKEHTK